MTKEELIKLKEQAATAAAAYSRKAEEARRRNAMANVSSEWQVEADIEAAKALDVSYAAEQAYKAALHEFVKQAAA